MTINFIRVRLEAANGAIGTFAIKEYADSEPVAWDKPDDGPTVDATFEHVRDGEVQESHTIDGDTWRDLESQGDLLDVPFLVRWGYDLEDAIDHAVQGFWPSDFDGEIARESDDRLALVKGLAEYAQRYADQNGEPENGDCRALLAQAAAHQQEWL